MYNILGENVSAGSSVSGEDEEEIESKPTASEKGDSEAGSNRVSRSSRSASASVTPSDASKN